MDHLGGVMYNSSDDGWRGSDVEVNGFNVIIIIAWQGVSSLGSL